MSGIVPSGGDSRERVATVDQSLAEAQATLAVYREAMAMAYGTLLAISDDASLRVAARLASLLFPPEATEGGDQ